jgi:hypothetical protein
MMEWISVEDRLPADGEVIMCWAGEGKNQRKNLLQLVTYVQNKWIYGSYSNFIGGVTHWMPLPEPPEESE